MSVMKFKAQITLFNSYFDFNNNLSAKSILSIFQDIASIHAEEIGVGYKAMLNKNLYWVLSRVKYDVLKMPQINETVVVETWPHQKGKIDFDRDMRILNKNGEVLVKATSKWCVINTQTRKLERSDNVNYVGEFFDAKNYLDKFDKIILPQQQFKDCFMYNVRFCDLDHNNHMNNTNYANLIVNSVLNKTFNHFEINFLNECLLNDQIFVSLVQEQDCEYVTGSVNQNTVFTAMVK